MLEDKYLCGLADSVISTGVVAASKRVAPLIASKKVCRTAPQVLSTILIATF